MFTESDIRIWGIVPAAGMSRRMGRPKQTLPFGDTTVVGTVARTLLEAGVDGVVVVTRTELSDSMDLPSDKRLLVAFNDHAASEMIDSVRIGLDRLAPLVAGTSCALASDGVLVMPGDIPAVSVDTCRHVISTYRHTPGGVVIATHDGRRGHPIIFPMQLRQVIHELTGGLNELSRQYSERLVEAAVNDPGILRDLDTPADYEARDTWPADPPLEP